MSPFDDDKTILLNCSTQNQISVILTTLSSNCASLIGLCTTNGIVNS